MKALLGEGQNSALRQVTEQARRLVDAKWDSRRHAMASAGASLTPKDIEDIFAEVTGMNLKATLKTARQLGRDFFRQWKERSEPGPISDAQYVALMRPYEAAYKQMKSPSDDLSQASVRQFVAVTKAEGKISGAWKAGFTETRKLRDAAEQKRKLEIIHAAPPDVFHKHDKNNGYGGVEGVGRKLATTTEPEVRARLQKMLDLMQAPLDY